MRRVKLGLLAAFLLFPAVLFVHASIAAQQDVPAERFYKNIQVLKGVPANRIVAMMAGINTALGVNCDYCHSMDALEKSDKPAHKAAVRDLLMTRDINDRYKMKVDCVNCHQGRAKPPGMIASGGPSTTTTTGPPPTGGTTSGPTPPGPSGGGANPPDKACFAASYGSIPFPHQKHADAAPACTTCHHTNKDVTSEVVKKCSACHLKAPGSITRITAKDVGHGTAGQRNCAGCHIKSQAGPTKCGDCHSKKC
ncbi:MAG TPA: photosynthetic reaction center cytochrome c subunit family protein [Blastocatellia bacterium]|nr:photosynthetic reaction center cytochrome c subunit family protein [Blastocatellia bacterium]